MSETCENILFSTTSEHFLTTWSACRGDVSQMVPKKTVPLIPNSQIFLSGMAALARARRHPPPATRLFSGLLRVAGLADPQVRENGSVVFLLGAGPQMGWTRREAAHGRIGSGLNRGHVEMKRW